MSIHETFQAVASAVRRGLAVPAHPFLTGLGLVQSINGDGTVAYTVSAAGRTVSVENRDDDRVLPQTLDRCCVSLLSGETALACVPPRDIYLVGAASPEGGTRYAEPEHFTEANGYTPDATSAIRGLSAGQTWVDARDSWHTVTRLDAANVLCVAEFPGHNLPDTALPAGFSDDSWAEDWAPSFIHALADGNILRLFIDHADAALSTAPSAESGNYHRYTLHLEDGDNSLLDALLETNDWDAVLREVEEQRAQAHARARVVTNFGSVKPEEADTSVEIADHIRLRRLEIRSRCPSPLGLIDVKRDIDGYSVTAHVSPCAWMDPEYGFQITVETEGGGSTIVHEPTLPFAKATRADIERLLDTVRVGRCRQPGCASAAFDPQACSHAHGGYCEPHFRAHLEAQHMELAAGAAAELATLDAKYKADGCTHRVDAVLCTGSDPAPQIAFWTDDPGNDAIATILREQFGCPDGRNYRTVSLLDGTVVTNPDSYTLDNAEERALPDPQRFQIPPRVLRNSVRPGQWVQLVFIDRAGQSEKMWVGVTDVNAQGDYRGRLSQDPMLLLLTDGEEVSFGPHHIINIITG